MYAVTPKPEDVFERFNPALKASNLANREARLRHQQEFLTQLKEYSNDARPIWVVAKEAEEAAVKMREGERERARDRSVIEVGGMPKTEKLDSKEGRRGMESLKDKSEDKLREQIGSRRERETDFKGEATKVDTSRNLLLEDEQGSGSRIGLNDTKTSSWWKK